MMKKVMHVSFVSVFCCHVGHEVSALGIDEIDETDGQTEVPPSISRDSLDRRQPVLVVATCFPLYSLLPLHVSFISISYIYPSQHS